MNLTTVETLREESISDLEVWTARKHRDGNAQTPLPGKEEEIPKSLIKCVEHFKGWLALCLSGILGCSIPKPKLRSSGRQQALFELRTFQGRSNQTLDSLRGNSAWNSSWAPQLPQSASTACSWALVSSTFLGRLLQASPLDAINSWVDDVFLPPSCLYCHLLLILLFLLAINITNSRKTKTLAIINNPLNC